MENWAFRLFLECIMSGQLIRLFTSELLLWLMKHVVHPQIRSVTASVYHLQRMPRLIAQPRRVTCLA
jgi:hypothetical protein